MSYLNRTSVRLVPLLLLALVASLVTASAVSAAPKGSGGPDGYPDPEPTETTPPPTTLPPTTAPPTTTAIQPAVIDFEVTTASVSALMKITHHNTAKIDVISGDGTTETLSIAPDKIAKDRLFPNTVFLRHTYDDNAGVPRTYQPGTALTSPSGTDTAISTRIEIEPRYFVTQTNTEFIDRCDRTVHPPATFDISRTSSIAEPGRWNVDPTTATKAQATPLRTASFYKEFTLAEASNFSYRVVEKTQTSIVNDETLRFRVHPQMKTGKRSLRYNVNKLPKTDCVTELRFTIGSGLLKPTIPLQPVAESGNELE